MSFPSGLKTFFVNIVKGFAIGVAFIIPGFSGGTVAAVLNVYDELIDAISGVGKHFAKSVKFLAPIFLGLVLAVAALYFPIKFALEYIPLPTILLFVGLIVGGLKPMFKKVSGAKPTAKNFIVMAVTLAATVGICFIPGLGEANLGPDMSGVTYGLLIVMGALSACALVVPGISGSMLLLIFGFYQPILNTVAALTTAPVHSLIVLLLFAAGVVGGFFGMSCLMKLLLSKFPRGTYWGILGFVLGSIPAIFCALDWGTIPLSGWQIALGIGLFVLGFALSFLFVEYHDRRAAKRIACGGEEAKDDQSR